MVLLRCDGWKEEEVGRPGDSWPSGADEGSSSAEADWFFPVSVSVEDGRVSWITVFSLFALEARFGFREGESVSSCPTPPHARHVVVGSPRQKATTSINLLI